MKKILIAEDQAFIRRLIGQSLRELANEGIELIFAADGEEALCLIDEHRPLLVLLDVMVPRLDGLEVCARIRQDARHQHMHIIVLIAKSQEYARASGREAGPNQYFTKPFAPDELLTTVRSALQL